MIEPRITVWIIVSRDGRYVDNVVCHSEEKARDRLAKDYGHGASEHYKVKKFTEDAGQ